MDRQILSQEEINALLKDVENTPQLSSVQKDALGEIGNISYGTASTALSQLLNKRVDINTPTVFLTTQRELKEQYPNPYVLVEVDYKIGLHGGNILILKMRDAAVIADLMMGGTGENPKETLDDLALSAVSEAMNQMAGNAATSLSALFSKRIEIDTPRLTVVDFGSAGAGIRGINEDDHLAAVKFKLIIEGLVDSEVMLILPYDFAAELVDSLLNQTVAPLPQETKAETVASKAPVADSSPSGAAAAAAAAEPVYRTEPKPQVTVQPAQFAAIGNNKAVKENGNIGLILDVPLKVTVELGSTRMKIKEILELGVGSIIELDKLAGDPVDIFVNGKLIAKGEVVVIDENFGIKVTDIVSQMERANTLQ